MTVTHEIVLTIADALEHFPLTYAERGEVRARVRQAQDAIFLAWDRMVAENPALKEVGTWPHLEALKERARQSPPGS
jgi:hypothetical protein